MAKSAAERAQSLVDTAQKNVDKLTPKFEAAKDRAAKAKKARDELDQQLNAATAELEFAKKHPALEGGAAQPAVTPLTEAEALEKLRESGIVEASDSDDAAQAVEPDPGTPDDGTRTEKGKGDLFDQEDPFA